MKHTNRLRWLGGPGVLLLCVLTAPAKAQQGVECSPIQAPYFDRLGVQTDFAAAAKRAADEKKPLVLMFSVNNARRPGFQ